MKQNLKRLASESFVYGVSSMLSRMVAVFMVPLYTAVLSKADYGLISLATSGFALISLFVLLSLDSAAHSWYWSNPTPEEQRKTISSWFWTSQASGLLLCALIWLTAPFWAGLLFTEAGPLEEHAVRMTALVLPLNFAGVVAQNWLRMQRRAVHYAAFSIASLLINVGLCAWFILGARRGVSGNFEALALTNLLIYAVAVVMLRKHIRPADFSFERLRQMFRFCLPLIFCAIPAWAMSFVDRYTLEKWHGTDEVGLYHVGSQLAMGVGLATGAFSSAWAPFALSLQHERDCRHTYAAAFVAYLLVAGALATGLAMLAPELIAVLTNKNYSGAADVTGMLTVGIVAYGLLFVAATGMSIVRQAQSLAVAYTLAAIVLTVGSLALVPSMGRQGAAVASSIAWCVLPLWSFRASQRVYPVPYPFGRGAALSALFLAGGWGLTLLPQGLGHPGQMEGMVLTSKLVVVWSALVWKFLAWLALTFAAAVLSWRSLRTIIEARKKHALPVGGVVETA